MKIAFTIILSFCSFVAAGQTINNQVKLKEKFGNSRYQELKNDNKNLLKLHDFRLDSGYVHLDYVPQKYQSFTVKNSFTKHISKTTSETITAAELISEIQNDNFNLLLYGFQQKKDSPTIIRVGNDHVLIIRSVQTINKLRYH